MCLFSARCAVPFLCDQPMCVLAISFARLLSAFRLALTSVYHSLLSPFSVFPLLRFPSSSLRWSGRSLRLSRCLPNTPTASVSSLTPPLFPRSRTCTSLFVLIWGENASQLPAGLQCETGGLKWCLPRGNGGALDAAECRQSPIHPSSGVCVCM